MGLNHGELTMSHEVKKVAKIETVAMVGVSFALGFWAIPGGSLLAGFLTAGATLGLDYYSNEQKKKNAVNNENGADIIKNKLRRSIGPLPTRKVAYGLCATGGDLVMVTSTHNTTQFHTVTAIAGHEIDRLVGVMIGGELIQLDKDPNTQGRATGAFIQPFFGAPTSTNPYHRKLWVEVRHGTDIQTAFPELAAAAPSEWTTNSRGAGNALVHLTFIKDANLYPNGEPNVAFIFRGKKVRDIRNGITATRAWSDNASLCQYDYWTDSDLGAGFSDEEMDLTTWVSSTNYDDERIRVNSANNVVDLITAGENLETRGFTTDIPHGRVTSINLEGIQVNTGDSIFLHGKMSAAATPILPAAPRTNFPGYAYSDGNGYFAVAATLADARAGRNLLRLEDVRAGIKLNEARHTINQCLLDTKDKLRDNINQMFTANSASPSYISGKVYIIKNQEPAAPRTEATTLREKDFVINDIHPKMSITERYNTIYGVYPSSNEEWQPSEYPTVTNTNFVNDDGREIKREWPLLYTISPTQAQRQAFELLHNSRQEELIEITTHLGGFKYRPGDYIYLHHRELGSVNATDYYRYRILNFTRFIKVSKDTGVIFGCRLLLKVAGRTLTYTTSDEIKHLESTKTNIPTPFNSIPTPSDVILDSGDDYVVENGAGGVTVGLNVSWRQTSPENVARFEILYKIQGAANYQSN